MVEKRERPTSLESCQDSGGKRRKLSHRAGLDVMLHAASLDDEYETV